MANKNGGPHARPLGRQLSILLAVVGIDSEVCPKPVLHYH